MKILITGGAGYVGQALVKLMRNFSHHKVTVIDKLLYANEYLEDVDFIYGDVSDEKLMTSILPNFDVVVNLAAIVGDLACKIRMTEAANVNLAAVKILTQHFDGRIIHMSTCSVYGKQEGVLTEDSPTNPLSWYAETKLYAEECLKNKDAVILRLGTLHGLSNRLRFDLVVNTLTLHALTKGEISVFGDGQWRPLLHVKDLAQCIVELFMAKDTGIYNLKQSNMTIGKIAEQVIERVEGTKLNTHPIKYQDHRDYQVSSAKFDDTFTYRPKLVVADTIDEIKTLYKEGRVKNYKYPLYSNIAQLTMTS